MEVITLNKDTFSLKCNELVSKLEIKPDLVLGILNGGGYILEEIKNKKYFENVNFETILLQRKNKFKNNFLVNFFLKFLPYTVADSLRIHESKNVRKSLNKLNLDLIKNHVIDFNFDSEKKTNILIVDDAIDTGKTMFIAKTNLKKQYPNAEIKIAVLSWTIENSMIKPDYYIFKNKLVRFPWSKDYKGKDRF